MTNRRLLIAISVVILVATFLLTLRYVRPAAPKKLDLLAGPAGTSYHRFAERYAEELGEKGVEVIVVETEGSLENLRRLASIDEPAVGFAQSGAQRELPAEINLEGLESLGSLAFEPLWLFVRSKITVTSVEELDGLRVALGPPGSGARAIASLILEDNGVSDRVVAPPQGELEPAAAADALLAGELDAVFIVGPPHAPVVSRLLTSEGVEPARFRRATAYTRIYPDLAEIVLPEGAFDLATNIPLNDLSLLAATTNLVATMELHPAAVDLLLDAARKIHREPTLFSDRGTFPNMTQVSLPLSEAAIRFYEDGPSPMRKYLPYWLATLINRFAVVILPVAGVALMLLKSVPALLGLRFSLRSLGIYRQMEQLERRLIEGEDHEQLMAALVRISQQSSKLKAPMPQLSAYLELKQNIHDLRERIEDAAD